MLRKKTKLVLSRALLNVLLTVSGGLFTAGGYGMITALTTANFLTAYAGFVGMLLYIVCFIIVEDSQ
jgi:hypothetical protein